MAVRRLSAVRTPEMLKNLDLFIQVKFQKHGIQIEFQA
jgi:hypothetical protein